MCVGWQELHTWQLSNIQSASLLHDGHHGIFTTFGCLVNIVARTDSNCTPVLEFNTQNQATPVHSTHSMWRSLSQRLCSSILEPAKLLLWLWSNISRFSQWSSCAVRHHPGLDLKRTKLNLMCCILCMHFLPTVSPSNKKKKMTSAVWIFQHRLPLDNVLEMTCGKLMVLQAVKHVLLGGKGMLFYLLGLMKSFIVGFLLQSSSEN